MSDSNGKVSVSRRTAMKRLFGLSLIVVAAPALVADTDAWACKKKGYTSKAVAMYQDKPHGNQKCSNCGHFCPGKTAQAMGTCNVVEGSISPHGWCVSYVPTKS